MNSIDISHIFGLDKRAKDWGVEAAKSMSLADKIGQVIVAFCKNADEETVERSLSVAPGAIYRPAGMDTDDLVSTNNKLQKDSKIPLLISTDLEYGSFGHLQDGTDQQVQLGIAATRDSEQALRMGRIVGRELEAVGFNWALSPVVDALINFQNAIIGTRSFGDSPETVREMASAYIDGVSN